jgi:hypothetical protein
VGGSVYYYATRSTDSLAAVVIKFDRNFAFGDQLLIQNIQKLQKRHVGIYIRDDMILEPSLDVRPILHPDPHIDRH